MNQPCVRCNHPVKTSQDGTFEYRWCSNCAAMETKKIKEQGE